ncbi:N-acetyltransferase family protein [Haloparvum sp. PAK95]|uniref:GNAT family N-acetyltransferase n=1 Tax=Haloparvum sp. PAK95 TaxID=3418962 RepID=UPI003D2F30D7
MSGGSEAADEVPVQVRQAEPADAPAVAAFTQDTWGEKHGDYIPETFPEWVETDDETQRTFVATVPRDALGDLEHPDAVVDDEVVAGCIQGVMLSDWEAWGQGIRVNPDCRGLGLSPRLSEAIFGWAREAGATVCRNMVFSWNVAGLGQSRSVGFGPCTEFRFAMPTPNAEATPSADRAADLTVAADVTDVGSAPAPDPNAAWSFWTDSDARDHLRGLSMDAAESWACSALTREELRAAAADDRLITVRDDGVAAMTYRSYVREGANDAGETVSRAIYGVAAWRDVDAAAALYAAVARDAAAVGADETRVLIPETVAAVSDTAATRTAVSDEPDFVLAADLTDPAVVGDDP